MSSKFKVGDKVKVKPFFLIEAEAEYIEYEDAGNLYYFDKCRTPFNENMKQFCEKEFVITEVESRFKGDIYYGLDGVGRWVITEDMVMSEELTREEFEEILSKLDKKIVKVKEEMLTKVDEINSTKEIIVDLMEINRKKIDFMDDIKLGARVRIQWNGDSKAGEYILCAGSKYNEVLLINVNSGHRFTSHYTREDIKNRLIELLERKDLDFVELIEE